MDALLFLYSLLLGLFIGEFVGRYIVFFPEWMRASWERDCNCFEARGTEDLHIHPLARITRLLQLCGHCDMPLTGIRSISLIHVLVFGGRCAACGERAIPQVLLPHLVVAVITPVIFLRWGLTYTALVYLLASWMWVAIAFISLRNQLMPDVLTLTLVWLGLLASVCDLTIPLQDAVLGAIAGYLLPWSLYHLVKLTTGRKILGYGTFKGGAATGAFCGLIGGSLLVCLAMVLKAADNKVRHGVLVTKDGLLPLGHWLAIANGLVVMGGYSAPWNVAVF